MRDIINRIDNLRVVHVRHDQLQGCSHQSRCRLSRERNLASW
jgi:hypothetical protein